MRDLQITPLITNHDSQSIESYFNDIGKIDLISADEEARLALQIKQGDVAALEKLVKSNLRFVVSVAKKYQHQGLSLSDLISEGNLGLIKAAKRFDETRGFKFISFAVWWIRQSMISAIIENARMIRLPLNKVNQITKVNQAVSMVEQYTLREPTCEQVAEFLNIPAEKVIDAQNIAPWTKSLHAQFEDDGDYCLLDKLPADECAADHILMAESSATEINMLLTQLSCKERNIIELSYGLKGKSEMSPGDISRLTGMSYERVRQIRNIALKKLRSSVSGLVGHLTD